MQIMLVLYTSILNRLTLAFTHFSSRDNELALIVYILLGNMLAISLNKVENTLLSTLQQKTVIGALVKLGTVVFIFIFRMLYLTYSPSVLGKDSVLDLLLLVLSLTGNVSCFSYLSPACLYDNY